jgi:hypothetical protein
MADNVYIHKFFTEYNLSIFGKDNSKRMTTFQGRNETTFIKIFIGIE